MLAEFALEPSLLHDWNSFQRLVGLFGVSQGRLISRFPNKWQQMVLDAASCGQLEKKKITEALIRATKSVLLPREHGWDPAQPWLDNAIAEHGMRPFDGILAAPNSSVHTYIVDAADLDVTKLPASLQVYPSRRVDRSAAQMAAAVRVPLQFSKRIVFIDRYFSPDNRRFRDPFEEMLMHCLDRHGRPRQVEIELHIGHRVLDSAPDFGAACDAHLQEVIPVGMRVTVARWNHDEFHNRYILTDRCGISIGQGLDAANSKSNQTEDTFVLLAPEAAAELMDRHCGAVGRAKQLLRHVIVGRKRTTQ